MFYSSLHKSWKIDIFGNNLDTSNRIDSGTIEDKDEFGIPSSKRSSERKGGTSRDHLNKSLSVGSKRTVGSRHTRMSESKTLHKSRKLVSKRTHSEDDMVFKIETDQEKLSAKKRSPTINNSDSSSCEESQVGEKGDIDF